MLSVETLTTLVQDELTLRHEEGCATGRIARKFEALKANPPADAAKQLEKLLASLEKLKVSKSFKFVEPSDLESIRAARPAGPRRMACTLDDEQLYDRILGAWQARTAGCLLGLFCEGRGRDKIEGYLRRIGRWPLSNYFPYVEELTEEFNLPAFFRTEGSLGLIKRMVRDDDTDYTILGLHILEKYGPGFTTENVGAEWLDVLAYLAVCSAERATYRNLINEIKPPRAGTFQNPWREWIGAQIRCDGFAYATPGQPELAAEFCYRDAALSHVKNGIYGEMFFGSMISAAIACGNLEEALEVGLSEIPANCRLAEAMRFVRDLRKTTPDWPTALDRIVERYGHYHRCHTINNAAVVLLGLLWGEGDMEKTLCISVMAGWDTDCNAATAGSVIGAILGAKALTYDKWIAPLNDTIVSGVAGYDNSRMTDLARRMVAVVRKIQASQAGQKA